MKSSLNTAAIKTAKRVLCGRWPTVIGVMAILAAALAAGNILLSVLNTLLLPWAEAFSAWITLAVAVFQLFGLSPLFYGALDWFWQTAHGAEEPVATVFRYYETRSDYRRAVGACLAIAARLVITITVCSLPAALFYVIAEKAAVSGRGGIYTGLLLVIALVLEVIGLLFALLFSTRWFCVIPCLLSDETLSINHAFVLSKMMTASCRTELFVFDLHFAGWALLSLLIIPLMYTVPHFLSCYVCRAKFLIRRFMIAAKEPAK